MRFLRLLTALATLPLAAFGRPQRAISAKDLNARINTYDRRAPNQSDITWDAHSLFVHGERVLVYSGEIHPWRIPNPSLWLDIFQKFKAAGFTAASFYVNWGLHEGKRGDLRFDGVFDYEPFFAAAKEAGIWLLARPGPYINAETVGGGFPGWGTRVKGPWKTSAPDYLEALTPYWKAISGIIAKHQLSNGGPVILFQVENEYSVGDGIVTFPDPVYMQYLIDTLRGAGVTIPTVNNDVWSFGNNAPGTGEGSVDIYGHDGYPIGFDCTHPSAWLDNNMPTDWFYWHEQRSPSTPYTIMEFQGGAFDPWGGVGYDMCAALTNMEFERVFNKNNYANGVAIFNMYMGYGGTNWGGINFPGVYTSYDYGSSIAEDRTITREKYSELKLESNFLLVSPAYLTSVPQNVMYGSDTRNGSYTDSQALAVTMTLDVVGNRTVFWTLRHAAYNSLDKTDYHLIVPTVTGNVTVPQLGGTLTLYGRDSKMHLTDYAFSDFELHYSSAEVFTWKKYSSGTVLVLYGNVGELHETAIRFNGSGTPVATVLNGKINQSKASDKYIIINYSLTAGQTVVKVGDLTIYVVDRNTAYQFWVLDDIIVRGAYLVRTLSVDGSTLRVTGDLNTTSTLELIGSPQTVKSATFNGKSVSLSKTSYGTLSGALTYTAPHVTLPSLKQLQWHSTDSLPEIRSSYSDSAWVNADHTYSNITVRNLTTPTSLYASDYGFHTGNLLYRGHFTVNSTNVPKSFSVTVQGGTAVGFAVYLDSAFLGSFPGNASADHYNLTVALPALKSGSAHVFTILQDHMGLNENWVPGANDFQTPRGILDFNFDTSATIPIAWKLTGNLGGEDYVDKTRGPLNEGGLYAERQGYHLPHAPTSGWASSSPLDGLSGPGVQFYTTSFTLALPSSSYDTPLAIEIANASSAAPTSNFRVQIYVNGYKFGKYISNVGPQTAFPIPQGVINHTGQNTLAVSLWALDKAGAKLDGIALVSSAAVQTTAMADVKAVAQPAWAKRAGAY